MDNARQLFEHELRDIYDAELKLIAALETMASKCADEKLSAGFREHMEVTKGQAERLEQIFPMVDRVPRREPCAGINGLIEEFSKFVQESPSEEVLDVFACGAAKKVEHYEIVSYKSLISLAQRLELPEAAELLSQTLSEEERTAQELESISPRLEERLDTEIVLPEEQTTS